MMQQLGSAQGEYTLIFLERIFYARNWLCKCWKFERAKGSLAIIQRLRTAGGKPRLLEMRNLKGKGGVSRAEELRGEVLKAWNSDFWEETLKAVTQSTVEGE